MYHCDPPGRSDPDSILCTPLDNPANETQFVFLFDQEPLQLSIHLPTFFEVLMRNRHISDSKRFVVVSETNSDNLDYICKAYNLQPFYYFYHGWAAMDWYRGYNRTYLIDPPEQRKIKKTFFSANRIIGGERSHRVLMLYHLQQANLMHNHISAPKICPVENVTIEDIAKKFQARYPDNQPNNTIFKMANNKLATTSNTGIVETVAAMDLPRLFPGEDTQRMSSCWLDQFDLCAESLIYHVSETVYFGRRQHLTEKTFKPIALGMPFVLSAPAGSLAYLRSYGFKTFDGIFDESYDLETDDMLRALKLTQLLKTLDDLSLEEKQQKFKQCIPIIKHNLDWFYNTGFEQVLWEELTQMLSALQQAAQ